MNKHTDDLIEHLTSQLPSFLFLGQAYLRLETGRDSLLAELQRKFSPEADTAQGYSCILNTEAARSPLPSLAWIAERCRRLSIPAYLDTLAGIPWSGVYTSAIDPIWQQAFRTPWRDLHPLFEERFHPSDPRNRHVLHATYLFGCVSRTDEAERPPLTSLEWKRRRQVAIALARRLPELLTPRGILLIEGYDEHIDWFSVDDLLPIIDSLNIGQVHWFGVSEDTIASHSDLEFLAEKGNLVYHKNSLHVILEQGEARGSISLGEIPDQITGRRLTLGDKVTGVPRDIWNRVSRSATVVDDVVLEEPKPLSDDARYQEFRNFLAATGGRSTWEAYARNFAFERDFEGLLQAQIESALEARTLLDDPLILHGPTGTGKTIALGSLAYKARKNWSVPVIFVERRIRRPVLEDIDAFCQWVQDEGVPATLLVWDGMLSPEDYAEFLRSLSGRGRKVVLVGSSYKLDSAPGDRFVEAPGRLTPSEVKRFATFLGGFHEDFERALLEAKQVDQTFLVALYRLLPDTRSKIRAGVSLEVAAAEETLKDVSKNLQTRWESNTVLGQALLRAGLVDDGAFFGDDDQRFGGEVVKDVEALTGLVMSPGQFGLRVPLELLMRAMGKPVAQNFVDILSSVDIFRWHEDEVGNIEIGPRSSLEAELITGARLGGPKTEIEFARRLLLELRDDTTEARDSVDIYFAVDFLRAIGPQGAKASYYSKYFSDLASALQELREERGVQNPRLILQEANLRREWVFREASTDDVGTRWAILEEVEEVLRQAIEFVRQERPRSQLKGHLGVELATALAGRVSLSLEKAADKQEASELFRHVRATLREVRREDPSNYYPVDVQSWVTRDVLKADALDEAEAIEAVADLMYSYQALDPDSLEPSQRERFYSRQAELAAVVGDNELEQSAFEKLKEIGSGAGYFLKALEMSGLKDSSRNNYDLSKIQRALRYLEQHRAEYSDDERCLDLLLDLWWLAKTGSHFFQYERFVPPLATTEWEELLNLVQAVEATGESSRPEVLAFFQGLAHFNLEHIDTALQIFHDLERASERVYGRRRIIRSYLVGTPTGEPRSFHGTVAWAAENGHKGDLFVEELRKRIRFRPVEFGRRELRKGQAVGDFFIAFNFRGPIAEPPTFHRSIKRQNQAGESTN